MNDIVISNDRTSNESNGVVSSTILRIKDNVGETARRALEDISNIKSPTNIRDYISPIKSSNIALSSPHSDLHVEENMGQYIQVTEEHLRSSPLFTDADTADSMSDYEDYHLQTEIPFHSSDYDIDTADRDIKEQICAKIGSEPPVHHKKRGSISAAQTGLNAPPGIPIEYIEERDKQDSGMVSEYSEEIFMYMRELELKMLPNDDYMDHQPELEWRMRRILLDWIIQVHERFRMLPETLFLCVNYIDRFLSIKEVSIDKLQLVGITALFIAAKYEELETPTVSSMLYMAGQTYSREELQKAERFMVNMLNYELGFPGPLNFLRRVSKSDDYDFSICILSEYLVEATIMYECFICYPPSLIAASCYYVARKMLHKHKWTSTHVHYSGYEERSLIYCASQLLECLEDPTPHQYVYTKYKTNQCMNASIYVSEYLANYHSSEHFCL